MGRERRRRGRGGRRQIWGFWRGDGAAAGGGWIGGFGLEGGV